MFKKNRSSLVFTVYLNRKRLDLRYLLINESILVLWLNFTMFNEFKLSALKDKDSQKWFNSLVKIWEVSEETCYKYLDRIFIKTCDLESIKEMVNAKLASIIVDNVLNCQDVLAQYIFENINKELKIEDFWSHLEIRGFKYLDVNKNVKLLNIWNDYKDLQLKKYRLFQESL